MTLAAPLLVTLLSCGDPQGSQGTLEGDLAGPDVPIDLELEEVYTVGSLDGEDWELFSRITRVEFDGSGNLFVFDPESSRIVVVDPSGAHARTMGAAGDGPGEFRMPMGMTVLDDGTAVVHDLGHQALMMFDVSGVFTGSVHVAVDGPIPGPDMVPHPSGGLVSASPLRFRMGGPGGEVQAPPATTPVSFFPLDGSPPRTLFEAWKMPPPEGDNVNLEGGGFTVSTRPMVAFEPEVLVGVLPDGRMALVDSTTYRIRILGADGEILDVLERPIQPRQVNTTDEAAERNRRLAGLASSRGPRIRLMVDGGGRSGGLPSDVGRRIMEQQIAAMVFADEIPVISDMAVDRTGRFWVTRAPENVGERGPTDLVDSDGTYRGTLSPTGPRTPDAFGPDGMVAHIESDELDVPVVRVRRLPEAYR
jgi:hypothetical protein